MADEERPVEEVEAISSPTDAAEESYEDDTDVAANDVEQTTGENQAPASGGDVGEQWSKWAEAEKLDNGKLNASKVGDFLSELGISMEDHPSTVEHFVGGRKFLSLDDTLTLVHMLLESPSPTSASGGRGGSVGQSAMKQILNAVLESGTLAYDDTVVKYMSKLDEHRKKCEADGRYSEAKVGQKGQH